MKKLFLLLASVLLIPAANAVEEDIHEKCLKASDYKGCIEVFSGAIKDQIKPGTQNIKLNIDSQVTADGNQCPSEFAYAGGGYCRRVVCEYAGIFGAGHHPDLAGKGMYCQKGIGQMRWGEWDKEKVRASVNPSCPDIPLEVGWQSTCHMSGFREAKKLESGDYDKAVIGYRKLLQKDPDNWVHLTNLGASLYAMGDYSEALVHLKRANEVILDENNKWLTQVNYALALEAVTTFSPAARNSFMVAIRKNGRKACSKSLFRTGHGDPAIAQRLFDDPQIRRACDSNLEDDDPRDW